MVTIIPSYVYSIFAALIVGTIIVSSCSLSMVNLKNEAENQQLANVDEYVAAQSLTLIAHVTEDGQNTTQFLDLPSQIGNQEYSISIANDSSSAWVESGFGATASKVNHKYTYQPKLTHQGLSLVVGAGLFCNVATKTKLLL